jgi:predicted ATPase/class 3 adenylate cyclase/DNA-binding CsgD family transcriptional regulator
MRRYGVSELPKGTVTLLFTDIEGSTRLLQRVGERYADILEACRQLLRTAFQQYHGHEIDTQGDAFFVAFARATDAVAASVAAQRALAGQKWPEEVVVRVRMGLHTGEPQLATENYVGLDVHRAARIMSAGHGGQVLLSQTTRDLAENALPDGVDLLDLGEHRLKDLSDPIRLFQLVIASLPKDFPPLKTLDSLPNNLPIQPTWLVGREREAQAIEDLLLRNEVRLVTLTGPGGVGKTRLGLQVAANLSDTFADGVYFVNLGPVRDPNLVLPAITQAFGLSEIRAYSLLDVLHNVLRNRLLLLLLDNFEQVVEAADLLADLLSRCAGLKLLVTSRMALHLRAEHEFAVSPLALPDPRHLADVQALSQFESVVLFVSRAQRVRPDFEVTTANAPAIAEICTRLDGLPLAIELAAARVNMLPPQALLARLSQRLLLLTRGARDAPARQQTLRNTLSWSYELLTPEEQRLFCHLAAFVGGCTLEAVEYLARALDDAPSDVLDTLASLIDKSLLRQVSEEGEEPHFEMLETIREYGLETLAAQGELECTRQVHAAYFLELAERAEPRLKGPEQIRWLKRLERDHDNLHTAIAWLLDQGDSSKVEQALRLGSALRDFWNFHGHDTEGLALLERALATHAFIDPSLRSKALVTAGWLANNLTNYAKAETLGQKALTLAREQGDPPGIAAALQLLGASVLFRDLNLSRALIEESLAMSRALGDSFATAWSAHILGILLFGEDDTAARSLLEESLALNRVMGTPLRTAGTLGALAEHVRKSDLAHARTLLEEGLALVQEASHRNLITAYLLTELGGVMLALGEITPAASLAEEGLGLNKELGNIIGVVSALLLLGDVAAAQEDYRSARARYEESLVIARESAPQDTLILADCLVRLAEVIAAQGEPGWAARLCGAAEAARESMGLLPNPEYPDRYERVVATTRVQLGEQAFTAARAQGRAMSLEQVMVAPASPTTPRVRTTGTSSLSSGKRAPTYHEILTAREVEVLRLVARGLTDAQVAEQLVISPRTVNSHLTAIFGKIQVSSRSAATRYAIEHHLI